jgi:hypothetical protein
MRAVSRSREGEQALVVVPQPAAKRLIARAVASLPSIARAKKEGLIVVGVGSTNAYVLEELLGEAVAKEPYRAGYVGRELGVLPQEKRKSMVVLERGEPKSLRWSEILARLSPNDVVIKGGNALDPTGTVGVFTADEEGGTVGKFYAAALARGVEVIIPISRLKSVHGPVAELARRLGKGRLRWVSGPAVGFVPLVGTVITETEAVEVLYGVHAEHVASGGVGRGEGAVVLLLSGEGERVAHAFAELARLAWEEPALSWEEG